MQREKWSVRLVQRSLLVFLLALSFSYVEVAFCRFGGKALLPQSSQRHATARHAVSPSNHESTAAALAQIFSLAIEADLPSLSTLPTNLQSEIDAVEAVLQRLRHASTNLTDTAVNKVIVPLQTAYLKEADFQVAIFEMLRDVLKPLSDPYGKGRWKQKQRIMIIDEADFKLYIGTEFEGPTYAIRCKSKAQSRADLAVVLELKGRAFGLSMLELKRGLTEQQLRQQEGPAAQALQYMLSWEAGARDELQLPADSWFTAVLSAKDAHTYKPAGVVLEAPFPGALKAWKWCTRQVAQTEASLAAVLLRVVRNGLEAAWQVRQDWPNLPIRNYSLIGRLQPAWGLQLVATPPVSRSTLRQQKTIAINQGALFEAKSRNIQKLLDDLEATVGALLRNGDDDDVFEIERVVVVKFQGSMYPQLIRPEEFAFALSKVGADLFHIFPWLMAAGASKWGTLTVMDKLENFDFGVLLASDVARDPLLLRPVLAQQIELLKRGALHLDMRLQNIGTVVGVATLLDLESLSAFPSAPGWPTCEDLHGFFCLQLSQLVYGCQKGKQFNTRTVEQDFIDWLNVNDKVPLCRYASKAPNALDITDEEKFYVDMLSSLEQLKP